MKKYKVDKKVKQERLASFLVTKNDVFFHEHSDYHTDIINKFGIHAYGVRGPNIVHVRFIPPHDNFRAPLKDWVYNMEQDIHPEWYYPDECEERTRKYLPLWAKTHLIYEGIVDLSKMRNPSLVFFGESVAVNSRTNANCKFFDETKSMHHKGGHGLFFDISMSLMQEGGFTHFFNESLSKFQKGGSSMFFQTSCSHNQLGGVSAFFDTSLSSDQLSGEGSFYDKSISQCQKGGKSSLFESSTSLEQRGGAVHLFGESISRDYVSGERIAFDDTVSIIQQDKALEE